MNFLIYISNFMIPLIIFYIVGFGFLMKKNIYDDFIKGANQGLKTVVNIMPTLVGLMMAVGILRASGFLDLLAQIFQIPGKLLKIPSELIPMIIVRMFSSSAATGLVIDIYKEHGADSYIGTTASIIMGCTETIFYTMSIYFMTAKVRKTRYTLAGALLATLAGVIASVILARIM